MPPRPRKEGVIKAVYKWLSPANTNAVNVFYLSAANGQPISLGDFDLVVQSMTTVGSGEFLNEYSGIVSTDWHHVSATFNDLGASGNMAEVTLTGGGSGASGSLPPQCTSVLSWIAKGVTWRGGRFRTYVPGVAVVNLVTPNSSQLVASFRNGSITSGRQMISFVQGIPTSTPFSLCGLSYFTHDPATGNSVLRSTPVAFPFLDVNMHGRLDSQRRRSGKEALFL